MFKEKLYFQDRKEMLAKAKKGKGGPGKKFLIQFLNGERLKPTQQKKALGYWCSGFNPQGGVTAIAYAL